MQIIPFPRQVRQDAHTLAESLPHYAQTLAAEKRRPRGIAMYLSTLRRVVRGLGDAPTQADLNAANLRRYQEQIAHLSGSSQENALFAVRSFCRWSMIEGLRDDDPTEALVWPKVVNKAPERLRESEIAALLARVRTIPASVTDLERWRWKRNARAVYLMLYAGLRLAETAALRWKDVDLEAKELTVRTDAAKGGNERVVPISSRLSAALDSVPVDERDGTAGVIPVTPGGPPISFKGMERVMDRWGPVALSVHAHQLRHAFATRMHRRGIPVRTIQVLLGHKDISTTQRYLGVETEELHSAVEVLDW